MNKDKLNEAVNACKAETREALETVLAELNQGQRKKITNNEVVKPILDRYGVEYTEGVEHK